MRKYIDIINEATKPTSTKTRDKIDLDFIPSLNQGGALTTATKKGVATKKKLPGGSKAKSKKRMQNVTVAPEVGAEAGQHFANLHRAMGNQQDIMSDDEARRIAGADDINDVDDVAHIHGTPDVPLIGGAEMTPTTENLPAIIRKEVAETGGRVNPEWTQVKHLPRYVQGPIRALGRAVFSQFTDTPIEDIQMIGQLAGNSEREIAGMMDWIKRHGVRDDATNIDFSQIMPGYTADATLWRTEDFDFLLVHDFGGYYIYGWAGGRGFHLGGNEYQLLGHDDD